jgi:hypothetical protein
MKPRLIPINPEHLINLTDIVRSDRRQATAPGEHLCCKYVKQVAFFQVPTLGIIHLNVEYCFVCGRKLER